MMTKPIAKQTLIIRKELKMRRGKEISQGAHAATAFLTNRLRDVAEGSIDLTNLPDNETAIRRMFPSQWEREWIFGIFKKIVLVVDTEQQLRDLEAKCKELGIASVLIEDHGVTEFKGVKTITALGIGPHDPEQIDLVTKGLEPY